MESSSSSAVMMAMKAEVGGNTICGGGGVESSSEAVFNRGVGGGIQLKKAKKERGCTAKERISKMPPSTAGKRSSIYRGVTRHRWTGRYEAHLWDKTTWNQNQNKKGKQVYLGAYDEEEAAARAYDLAALKYWGPGTLINFPVTDYTRDLDEMQNVSREEYLASLRRKSSGFSRGLSKYRGLSSTRWDSSFGRTAGSDYYNTIHCGDHPAADNEYVGGFTIERKIDLTGYIKWWGNNKTRQSESTSKSSDETKYGSVEDVSRELKSLEGNVQASEPYQMPCLGTSVEGKQDRNPKISAMSILSRSAAFKSLQEREPKIHENNENENKNTIARVDHGKAIEKTTSHGDGCSEKVELPQGMAGPALSIRRNMYPLTSFLTAPLLTSYSSIDPLVDPILWASLAPGLPPLGLSQDSEVTKTEASSTYTFFQADE